MQQLINYNGQLINLNGSVLANKFPIRDGLVFYLDGGVDKCYAGTGTTATDLSVSSVSTSLNNGVGFSEDNKGYFSFDGVNDYMRTSGGAVSMGHTQQRTTCAWIRLDDYNSSWKAIAEHTTNFNSNNGGFLLDHSEFGVDGSLQQSIRGSIGYNIAYTDDPYDSNTWYFWCATYDASLSALDCQQHYINGEQVDFSYQATHRKDLNEYGRDNEDLYFNSRAGSTSFSNHDLGAFYLYDRVLSQDEIRAIYNHQKQRFEHIITDGLVLDLDATNLFSYPGTGTTWSDISPTIVRPDATLVNGPTYQSEPAAIVFDGVDDYVDIDDSDTGNKLDIKTGDLTISVWAKYDTIPSSITDYLVSKAKAAAEPNRFGVGLYPTGKPFIFLCFDLTYGDMYTIGVDPIEANVWYNLTYVVDRDVETKIYVNGQQVSVTNNSNHSNHFLDQSSAYVDSSFVYRVGGYPAANGTSVFRATDGEIAEVQQYNRALTDDEIAYNFNARRGRYGV